MRVYTEGTFIGIEVFGGSSFVGGYFRGEDEVARGSIWLRGSGVDEIRIERICCGEIFKNGSFEEVLKDFFLV